jgi:hypothetical protein
MSKGARDIRSALIRQWELIANAVPRIDLSMPSRIGGWSNREVLAHLYVQPGLVVRFLDSAVEGPPTMGLVENLSGTKVFHDLIDSSARKGAVLGKSDLGIPLARARTRVLDAELDDTVVTLQGSISVSDYLVTRCVEAVVHGCDIVDPVEPDPEAQEITRRAMLDLLAVAAPHLVVEARSLPVQQWIDIATGRSSAPGHFATFAPVMA